MKNITKMLENAKKLKNITKMLKNGCIWNDKMLQKSYITEENYKLTKVLRWNAWAIYGKIYTKTTNKV